MISQIAILVAMSLVAMSLVATSLVATSPFALSVAVAADTSAKPWKGAWKFEIDRQDQPFLTYGDPAGKTVFRIGCGAHFDMRAAYPGAPKPDDTKATITIANGKTQMDFPGAIGSGTEFDPPHTTMFDQPDLGYAREDPELYEDKWHALEKQFFDLLDSGQPLTISAEGKSYVLPPIKVPRWRARFNKIC
jgi:hypothetical protein